MDTNEKFITLTSGSIVSEHICCAISDKKCAEGYRLKKEWLSKRFDQGYVFRRLDQRAKVFIEYCPDEIAWMPIEAKGYLVVNCFWVSGQYKGKGYAKALLNSAVEDAKRQKRHGLVTITGTKKFHFMSDGRWLLKNGFEEIERLDYGFSLLVMRFDTDTPLPRFSESVRSGECPEKDGIAVYYSNRCPFTEYHVHTSLAETAKKRGLQLKVTKFENAGQAKNSPSPATIFSLFYNGRFITTDVSVCMDSRFDKIITDYQQKP